MKIAIKYRLIFTPPSNCRAQEADQTELNCQTVLNRANRERIRDLTEFLEHTAFVQCVNLLTQSNAITSQTGMRNENVRGELPLFPITCQRNNRNCRTVFVCLVIADDNGGTDTILHMGFVIGLREVDKSQFQSGAADTCGGHGFQRIQILDVVVHLVSLL